MNNMVIIIMLAFLVVVYVFAYTRHRKRKKANTLTAVEYFHATYLKKKQKPTQDQVSNIKNYQRYITKYNSSEDYRSKDALVEESDKFDWL